MAGFQALRRTTRSLLRHLLRDRERFELMAGLTFFTVSLGLFLLGWTAWRWSSGAWAAIPAGIFAALGLMGLSGKVPLSSLLLNRGLVAYEPKRGNQIAVVYGALLFGAGIFSLSSLTQRWLTPTGTYGLVALLGTALILGGLYIVGSTPVFDAPAPPPLEPPPEPPEGGPDSEVPWFILEDDTSVQPESVRLPCLPGGPFFAVPQVRPEAALKQPSMLAPEDILAYVKIECDWVETPANYSCVAIQQATLPPCIESGHLVGINHAILEPRWLLGKLVAVAVDGAIEVGYLAQEQNGWCIRPHADAPAKAIEAVRIVGAVEWSLKPNSFRVERVDGSAARRNASSQPGEHLG